MIRDLTPPMRLLGVRERVTSSRKGPARKQETEKRERERELDDRASESADLYSTNFEAASRCITLPVWPGHGRAKRRDMIGAALEGPSHRPPRERTGAGKLGETGLSRATEG